MYNSQRWSRLRTVGLAAGAAILLLSLFLLIPADRAGALPTILYRVNAGGPALTAIDGGPDWEADQPSPYVNVPESGNQTFAVTNTVTATPGVPPALFQTERFDGDETVEMAWTFPVSATTEVEIRLYLAEIFNGIGNAGERIFDVSVEGTVPASFDDLDPFALGGNQLYAGSVVTTTATVTDGYLNLVFLHDIIQNPAIKGIEIIAIAETPTPNLQPAPSELDFGAVVPGFSSALSLTLEHVGLSGSADVAVTSVSITGTHASDFAHNITLPPTLSPGNKAAFEVTFAPSAEGVRMATLEIVHDGVNSPLEIPLQGNGAGSGSVIYRVNAGGELLTAADDSLPDWGTDTNGSPSPYRTAGGDNSSTMSRTIDMSSPTLPSSVPAALFQSERWDPDTGSEMTWSFPISTSLNVEVRLYLAETFTGITGAGQRVFDVQVEGVTPTLFANIDPWALTGGQDIAIMLSHITTVDDGSLDLVFLRQVENPAVKGIELVLTDSDPTALALNDVNTLPTAPRAPLLVALAALAFLSSLVAFAVRGRET